jgi:hypothetical protein
VLASYNGRRTEGVVRRDDVGAIASTTMSLSVKGQRQNHTKEEEGGGNKGKCCRYLYINHYWSTFYGISRHRAPPSFSLFPFFPPFPEMTFIDITGGDPSPGLIAGYSILAVVSLACTLWAIHLGRSRLHYNSSFSVRILFPVALAILTLENIALAISGLIYDKLENDGVDDSNYDSYLFVKAIFILQPFEVPLLLVVVFELTYLVHKSRSVNFCGMDFDEGRRVHNTAVMSCMLRNSIRTLATLLLIMGLIVNLDLIQDNVTIDALVGRAGWHSFFTIEGNAKAKMHLLLSLLPVAVLVLVSIYLSVMLWR